MVTAGSRPTQAVSTERQKRRGSFSPVSSETWPTCGWLPLAARRASQGTNRRHLPHAARVQKAGSRAAANQRPTRPGQSSSGAEQFAAPRSCELPLPHSARPAHAHCSQQQETCLFTAGNRPHIRLRLRRSCKHATLCASRPRKTSGRERARVRSEADLNRWQA